MFSCTNARQDLRLCLTVTGDMRLVFLNFFFTSRRRHTRCSRDWSSDVCSSDLKVYSDVNLIPYRETALVLGADQKSAPEFFSKRIDAAFILYKAGKVKNFIVSGCVEIGRASCRERV